MPPRRSRRTAGKDPVLLEEVEGKPGGDDGVGKTVGQGKEAEVDNVAVVELEGAAIRGSTEKHAEASVKEPVVMSKSTKEDLGKQSSVENLEDPEASCCGGILQAGDGNGKKSATNSMKNTQNASWPGNRVEQGSSGGQGNHLSKTNKVLSSSRRLNASSSEEEFYSGEEEVNDIFLLALLRALVIVCAYKFCRVSKSI